MEPKTRESSGSERSTRAEDESLLELLVPSFDGERVDDVDRQGTEDSFEELVRQHLTHLHCTALRLTRDRATAEDLVQDTLERAYRAFERYRPEGRARAWLGCIMRNLWITECRRPQSSLRTVPLDGAEELTLDDNDVDALSTEDAEAIVLAELGVASILGLIDDLPSHLKQVIVLALLRDVPYGTIAEMLEVPIGTVASRLCRGRRRLQGVLRNEARVGGALARAS